MKFCEWLQKRDLKLSEEFGIGGFGVAGTAEPLPGNKKLKIRKIDRPAGLGNVGRSEKPVNTSRDPG